MPCLPYRVCVATIGGLNLHYYSPCDVTRCSSFDRCLGNIAVVRAGVAELSYHKKRGYMTYHKGQKKALTIFNRKGKPQKTK